MTRAAVALTLSAALGGCYDTPEPACAFLCGPSSACPAGYRCAEDGWCKRDDVPADFTCDELPPDATIVDGAPDGTPGDAGPDAAADAASDAGAEDAGPDATVDAAPDAMVDAMPDAAPDATPDATPDAG